MPKKESTKTKKTPAKKAPAKKTPAKKAPVKKPVVKKETKKKKEAADTQRQYYEAVGRRKQATARVRLFTCRPFEGEKAKIIINGKDYLDFLPTFELQETVVDPLRRMKSLNRFEVTVKVTGGGIRGQAEAIRHGLSRTLIKFNSDFTKKLKRAGYLRRDPRKKERKKPGLKKARRAPQWRKR